MSHIKDLLETKEQKVLALQAAKLAVTAQTRAATEAKKKLQSAVVENSQVNKDLQQAIKEVVKADTVPVTPALVIGYIVTHLSIIWASAATVLLAWAILAGGIHLPPLPMPPGPIPVPTPTPGPKPMPSPVPKDEKIHITLIYSDQEMTPAVSAIRRNQKLRDYIKSINGIYFDYAQDSRDLAGKNFEKVVADFGTPCLIIQDNAGKKIAADKLPGNVEDTIKFIHDATGR